MKYVFIDFFMVMLTFIWQKNSATQNLALYAVHLKDIGIYIYIYIYLLGCFYPQQLPTASNIATYLVVFCCYPEVATHNKKNKTKQNKKTLKK